jgi:hypothetical protein
LSFCRLCGYGYAHPTLKPAVEEYIGNGCYKTATRDSTDETDDVDDDADDDDDADAIDEDNDVDDWI